jgi:hypothetical protein
MAGVANDRPAATSSMKAMPESRTDPAMNELACARRIVSILFEKTGLSTIVASEEPTVIVGAGNWISFTVGQALSSKAVFSLQGAGGKRAFARGAINRSRQARSRTSPSLHLTNLDSGEALRGHVDAHYWAKHPLRHAGEFFTKKTAAPSGLLERLQKQKSPPQP